ALELGLVHRPRAHRRRPVLVVAVLDEERERAPERPAVAEAAARLDVVLLELLARAAAVAGLTAGEIGPDQLVVDLEPRREAGDDDGEPGAVRLPCGDVRELHAAMEVTDWPVTRATSPALSHLVVMIARNRSPRRELRGGGETALSPERHAAPPTGRRGLVGNRGLPHVQDVGRIRASPAE